MLKNVIQKNSYYDSATLMLLTSKVAPRVGGSSNVAVMMGTEMNKEIMRASNLLDAPGEAASPNDLVFAVRADEEEEIDAAIAAAKELLEKKNAARTQTSNENRPAESIDEAVERLGGSADIAVVSLPGAFAHFEVKHLLQKGINVLLFSDNVSVENEIALKDYAIERGLLMMGPDCGTAVVNGVGLGFSNKVNRGSIGIVAASGTGLQEVMTLVSNAGGGISQALGTGGRDVKEAVGGRMMLHCLDMLEADPQTEIICIVSKPPAPSVVRKLIEKIDALSKPVVACLLGDTTGLLDGAKCSSVHTLTEAAKECLNLAGLPDAIRERDDVDSVVEGVRARLLPEQKYVRGLYCGGTLCYESQIILQESLGTIRSNAPLDHANELEDVSTSVGHTILDLGADEFTVGRPHPMIEPSLRHDRLIQEALDSETAVVLVDIETGYGSNDNAASILADEVREARELLSAQNRFVAFFGTVCGSVDDYQGYDAQKQILEESGVVVFETNEQLARAAAAVLAER